MNSRSGRIIKQFLSFLLIAPMSVMASQSTTTSSYNFQTFIEQQVLAQWQSLGQRADEVSKVIISGLPQGYKSPNCESSWQVKAGKQLVLGRNSIQVSCQHRSSWSLMLNADIEVWRDVVVFRDHISRGEKLGLSDITLQQRNIGKLQRGYYTDFKDIIGNISKRSLKAGTAVSPSMINLPIIVKRGQTMTLRVERPGFAVNMKGIALKKGRKGDSIKVKNSSSNKVLFGTIVHGDLVLVN
jgi:flagella basal body P-ring formation protein FlgA